MDFNDNPKEAEFRSQVREFLDKNAQKRSDVSLTGSSAGAPETVSGEDAAKEALKKAKEWQKKKAEAGLAAIFMAKRIRWIWWHSNRASNLSTRRT